MRLVSETLTNNGDMFDEKLTEYASSSSNIGIGSSTTTSYTYMVSSKNTAGMTVKINIFL